VVGNDNTLSIWVMRKQEDFCPEHKPSGMVDIRSRNVNVKDVGNTHTLTIWVKNQGDIALNMSFLYGLKSVRQCSCEI